MDTPHITADSAPLFRRAVGGIACRDCGGWAHDGERIRHGRRCDVAQVQPTTAGAAGAATRSIVESAREGVLGRHSDDEILDAVRAGVIDGMNRDD